MARLTPEEEDGFLDRLGKAVDKRDVKETKRLEAWLSRKGPAEGIDAGELLYMSFPELRQ